MAYPIGGRSGGSIVTAVLFVSGICVMWKDKRRFLLALLVFPFLFTWLGAIFHAYPYGFRARIAQHLAPSICMLAAVGLVYWLARFSSTRGKLTSKTKIACIVLCCVGLLGIGYTFVKPYKATFDWEVREVVQSFYHDNDCRVLLVPNKKEQVQINFRWYLFVTDAAIFNSMLNIQTGHERDENRPVCIMFFEPETHVQIATQLDARLIELQVNFEKVLDREGKVFCCDDHQNDWQSYRQIVLRDR